MVKIALVVGHNQQAQGAYSDALDETEYGLWSEWAPAFRDKLYDWEPDWNAQVFYRTAGPREIKRVYGEVNAWGADVSIELHFNSFHSPAATGTETWSSGYKGSMRLATALQETMVARFGLSDRGVKVVHPGARGGINVHSGKCPAVLVEPFFGSSEYDCEQWHAGAMEQAVLASLRAYFADDA